MKKQFASLLLRFANCSFTLLVSVVFGLVNLNNASAQGTVNNHFSPASRITQLDDHTYQIVAEIWDSPTKGHGVASHLHFALPPGAQAVKFQGTVSSQSFCGGTQILFFINLDGQRYAPVIHKYQFRGSTTTFESFDIPFNTRSGNATIEIGATGNCYVNEEVQGTLLIQ